ncbi:MAG: PIN domain-containing protein [Rubrobacteraceae bacterium]|nr:PIN domain-containing protein [Rubrobacteraceae bacterium]MBA3615975.1 PIN domain-containing protein [Rubrobacteraceae bacterium]
MSRCFFDTNVLLYLFDDSVPEKKAQAQEVFSEEVEAGRAVLSTQVLQEFYVSVTRKLAEPLPSAVAEAQVRDFARLPLVRWDEVMILSAIERHRSMSFSFWDALILEAALRGGADRLLTEDMQHGQKIEGLLVENPFLEAEEG